MPNPATTRRTGAARRSVPRAGATHDGTEMPQRTSFYDAATIDERIRKWQAQEVVEAVDPDVLSVRSQSRSETNRTPARSRSPHVNATEKEANSTPRKNSNKWVQQGNNTWVKQRESQHGRTKPDEKRGDTEAAPSSGTKETIFKQDMTPPIDFMRTESQRTRNVNSSRAEREERRKRRRETRARANGGAALVDDGIRVYMKSQSNLGSDHDKTGNVDPEEQESQRNISSQEHSPKTSLQDRSQLSFRNDGPPSIGEDDFGGEQESPIQPSKYAQTLGRPPAYAEDLEQPKTRKRTILNKTKEILIGKNEASDFPSNRIPSIEAWLEEQPNLPDPFVENHGETVPPATDLPKPPKHKSRRRKISVEPIIAEVEDPNKIWDSLNDVAKHDHRDDSQPARDAAMRQEGGCETSTHKRRLFSFEICDEPSKVESSTPPPLDHAEDVRRSPNKIDLPKRPRRSRRDRQRSSVIPAIPPEISEELPTYSLNRENSIQPDRDISPRKQEQSPKLLRDKANAVPIPSKDIGQADVQRADSQGLKRKLTTHEDLLSVLSQPRVRKSTRSTRSKRNPEATSGEAIIPKTLSTMREEEQKYIRELRTLVDGVTPVLLQSLLSKTDAAATAGLFSGAQGNDASFTRPIIDMGVALQRLKNLHSRMPLQEQNVDGLLTWATTAHKTYTDYVRSWRLGFQGVIVNLAPLDSSEMTEREMLARDVDGDVTNEQGQKVDVAYLQKRPLVRIKKMAKLFSAIQDALPDSDKAASVASMYAELSETAKQRYSEEQGRLEDEAAANIDTTRARDIRTMAPLQTVEVDKTRKVRARDDFNLSLSHSSGQRLDCRIEILLRDDSQPGRHGGDVLICQLEDDMRWLLFQPILLSNVSARRDRAENDLVLMLKGIAGIGQGWHELLALRAEDAGPVTEWLHMLGSNPLPPKLNHEPSWRMPEEPIAEIQQAQHGILPTGSKRTPLSASALSNLPSDIDVPIGEPSLVSTLRRPKTYTDAGISASKQPEKPPQLSMGGGLQKKILPERYQHAANLPQRPGTNPPPQSPAQSSISSIATPLPSRPRAEPKAPVVLEATGVPSPKISEASAPERAVQSGYSPQKFSELSLVSGTSSSDTYISRSDITHISHRQSPEDAVDRSDADGRRGVLSGEPLMSGALPSERPTELKRNDLQASSEPTETHNKDIGTPVGHPRKHSRIKSFSSTPLTETLRDQWASLSGFKKKSQSTPSTPQRSDKKPPSPGIVPEDLPAVKPTSDRAHEPYKTSFEELPPSPPAHRSKYTISSSPRKSSTSLPRTPVEVALAPRGNASPLKQEYQPSSSDSSTDSESDETDATSEMSDDDFRSELKDQATPLVQVGMGNHRSSFTPSRPLPSVPSIGTRTLDPSDSASNGPYRRAPPPSSFPASKKRRTIAMVCSWSDQGVWEPIQEDECSIVISPGLVQAFPLTAAHSQPMGGADWEVQDVDTVAQNEDRQPLVEFELTPIVPLRKGTALDITIRSPPTSNSLLKTTCNVMFRSRTVQECESLYRCINWARCNNPTYAQLARARAQEQPVVFASSVAESKTRSWFSFGSREKSSYRASSRPPTSIAETTTSNGSVTSAFSALKRFGKNSPFSLNRSSVIHRPGLVGGAGSLYSSSNEGSGSGSSTPAPASQAGFIPGPDGPNVPQTSAEAANGGGMVNNMKVRLFLRQDQKWEALGQALLTVLPAAINNSYPDSRPGSSGASTPPTRISQAPSLMLQPRTQQFRLPSSGNTPHRIHGDGREKRILITAAKRKDTVLLDEILGESCFEKVMQTGVAVNVWKEDDEVQEYGGVMTGRSRTYMIQFRTSSEATWVFNLCGTYRYGAAAA